MIFFKSDQIVIPHSAKLCRHRAPAYRKAVCILLTLLHLGIKNILLGPSLPAFLSTNVLHFLVENYGIKPISTPEEDLKRILK